MGLKQTFWKDTVTTLVITVWLAGLKLAFGWPWSVVLFPVFIHLIALVMLLMTLTLAKNDSKNK